MKFYTENTHKDNAIKDVRSIELNQDATTEKDAVRKSQAETISANAVQDKVINQTGLSASDNVYSASLSKSELLTKQPNMVIDESSTPYLEIVDGYKIKLKDLGIISNYKDTSNTTQAEFIADCTFNGNGTITIDGETLDAMTFIFLENATNPQERSFIYRGTDIGGVDDFITFSIDYNQSEIRTFFGATGTGISYNTGSGIYSLVFGNSAEQLGAHTLPVDQTEFSTVVGGTILDLMKSLEALIIQVDADATGGSATNDTRLTNLSGVTGANLLSFSEGIFTPNSTIKAVLQESESLHVASTTDRTLIRSQFASADAGLQANIDAEATSRASADSQEEQARLSYQSFADAGRATLFGMVTSEQTRAISSEGSLSGRLDVVEGADTVSGSIAKAEKDAKAYADGIVSAEQNRALGAEASLNTKIDNLQEGDITFVGMVQSDGSVSIRQARVDAGDTRNGADLSSLAVVAGETFVAEAGVVITFGDSSTITLQKGDTVMAVDDKASSSVASDFNVVQADESAITVANINDARIEQDINGQLDIVADSIGRTQLDSAIEADIDDARSKTATNAITSDGDTHFVSSSETGDQQNVYLKRTQLGSSALTGTARTSLQELIVNTNGSGNPASPSYAHVVTNASHYQGSCLDLTVVMAGGNFEANADASSAIQATGTYSSAIKPQLGMNIGSTSIGNGGATSNVGAVNFAGTAGVGNDRGSVNVVSSYDIVTYGAMRVADPFPYQDIAVVGDAKYAPAGTKAGYFVGGDVIVEGGNFVTPSATDDTHAVNLGDVKAKQAVLEMSLFDGVEKTVAVSQDLSKCIIQSVCDTNTVEVDVVRDIANNQVKITADGADLASFRLIIQEMSCAVTSV